MADKKDKPSVTNEVISSILGAIPWALGAGGLGALGGYFFTGGDKDEDPKARMQRRLKNALIMGAMGAGIGGGGKMAYDLIGDDKATLSEELGSAAGDLGDLTLDAIGSDYFKWGGGAVGAPAGGYLGYKLGANRVNSAVDVIKGLNPKYNSVNKILTGIQRAGDIDAFSKLFTGNEAVALNALKTVKAGPIIKGVSSIGSGIVGASIPPVLSIFAGNAGEEEREARERGD